MTKDGTRTRRLFAAVPLPRPLLDRALEAQLALGRSTRCRLVPEGRLHLTLAFLGEVPAERTAEAEEALRRSCASAARPVMLEPSQLGFFGNPDDALVWMGIEQDGALRGLAATLRGELESLSLPCDGKEFLPHVTLARKARLDGALPRIPGTPACAAAEAVLFESELAADGPRYRALASFGLPAEEERPVEPAPAHGPQERR